MKFLYVLLLPMLFTMLQSQTVPPEVIDKYLAQYSPYEMKFDASGFSEKEKSLLQKLLDRKSTRLNSSHIQKSRMPSSA